MELWKESQVFKDRSIAVGVTGGIAAYKSAELVRLIVGAGAQVHVIMTPNAAEFVSPLTFEALTSNHVTVKMFDETGRPGLYHTDLAAKIDATVVAPATANIIGKMAAGIADDFLSTFLLATEKPILIAPSMNPKMFSHPATQENLQRLTDRGVMVVAPGCGDTACGEHGVGRLEDPRIIFLQLAKHLGARGDFAGRRILITAGPTREPIDPVRYLTNRSSGKMGYALADAAVERGAEVILVTGPVNLQPHPGVSVLRVETSEQMYETIMTRSDECCGIFMAAAVADWRPDTAARQKLKKSEMDQFTIRLAMTRDILQALGERKQTHQVLLGFAAETNNIQEYAKQKLIKKSLDAIFANDVSRADQGFETDSNSGVLFFADGSSLTVPLQSKRRVADAILDALIPLFDQRVPR